MIRFTDRDLESLETRLDAAHAEGAALTIPVADLRALISRLRDAELQRETYRTAASLAIGEGRS